MGLPVPGIFLYREQGIREQMRVIDGQQRLLESLRRSYYGGQFRVQIASLN